MPWIIEGDDHIGDDVGGGEEQEEGEENSILPDMDAAESQAEEEGEVKPKTEADAHAASTAGRRL